MYRPRPLIVDAHLDLAYNAVCFQRNYRRSALRTRALEDGSFAQHENGLCTVGLPELVRGRVGLVFGTVFVEPHRKTATPLPVTYRTEAEAHALAMQQVDFYHRWEEAEPHVILVKTRKDLERVAAAWGGSSGSTTGPAVHPVGIVMLMEGADPIREPKELERWYERGVRIVGPAWTQTRYAGGTGAPGGLTDLGRELLQAMAQFNVVLDVSHLAEKALYEALERFEGAHVIASHSNPQRYAPTDRHLPDKAIGMLAERGGVIGAVLYNRFLTHDWAKGDPKRNVTLDHVVRAIDYVCQLTGSADHAAIGSDYDGGFGAASIPRELDTIRDHAKVGDALLARGYADADVDKIMAGNWLRVLRGALP